jgi:glycosyltransferase involved in cell wall biosynthesis
MTHRKGTDLLAQAFVKIAARHPKARLVLLGSGELEHAMRNQLHSCADRVTWLGFQPWDQLPACYAQGSIFCFPSRYDGWGMAMVEALAAGMPAIGTDRSGAALEFLSEGKAGWLIGAGIESALVEAMESALTLSEAEFGAMQRAAREAVAQNGLQEGIYRFNAASQDVLSHWLARMPGIPERKFSC